MLAITRTSTIGPTDRLEIAIAGATPGRYGSLAVTGAATLDGGLALDLSGFGLILTLGALAGLAAWLLGLLSTGRRPAIAAAGVAELSRLQAKLACSSAWSTILATAALALMAAARYR